MISTHQAPAIASSPVIPIAVADTPPQKRIAAGRSPRFPPSVQRLLESFRTAGITAIEWGIGLNNSLGVPVVVETHYLVVPANQYAAAIDIASSQLEPHIPWIPNGGYLQTVGHPFDLPVTAHVSGQGNRAVYILNNDDIGIDLTRITFSPSDNVSRPDFVATFKSYLFGVCQHSTPGEMWAVNTVKSWLSSITVYVAMGIKYIPKCLHDAGERCDCADDDHVFEAKGLAFIKALPWTDDVQWLDPVMRRMVKGEHQRNEFTKEWWMNHAPQRKSEPMATTADPNFPVNLNIRPLHLHGTAATDGADAHNQVEAIGRYGIAGRVWEASGPLLEYLTPDGAGDPPCTLFTTPGPHRVLELGSGQALASLHLAARLGGEDTVVLTDLPNVVPLCQRSIDTWDAEGEGQGRGAGHAAKVVAEPLAWGEDAGHLKKYGPWTHILMCDLVYFPHLYPPLLRTLLEVTEPTGPVDTDVFGPEVILAWKSRSLSLEESFFDSFARYFRQEPVTDGKWDPEVKLFICRRWRVTDEWRLPGLDTVMNGAPGVVPGRSYTLVDSLFSSMEWD